MSTIVTIVGVVFLVLGALGALLALLEKVRGSTATEELGAGPVDPKAWAKLVEALTKAPLWLSLTVVGIILLLLAGAL